MGEVILGIDFRAGKEPVPLCNAPDVQMKDMQMKPFDVGGILGCASWKGTPDTSPSEMDSGDCA